MKIGDLVELSAKGKTIQQNMRCFLDIGIIYEIRDKEKHTHPYCIRWLKEGNLPMARYEIKKVKKKS